jgi:hypothetical protein
MFATFCHVLMWIFKPFTLHANLQERWETAPAAAAVAEPDGVADGGAGVATWIGNSKDIAGSYTPFSTGIRSCLGQVLIEA